MVQGKPKRGYKDVVREEMKVWERRMQGRLGWRNRTHCGEERRKCGFRFWWTFGKQMAASVSSRYNYSSTAQSDALSLISCGGW